MPNRPRSPANMEKTGEVLEVANRRQNRYSIVSSKCSPLVAALHGHSSPEPPFGCVKGQAPRAAEVLSLTWNAKVAERDELLLASTATISSDSGLGSWKMEGRWSEGRSPLGMACECMVSGVGLYICSETTTRGQFLHDFASTTKRNRSFDAATKTSLPA